MSANPFIYFSGDSFMAGSELADDTLPSWGGYVTHDWIQAETFADRKIRITKYKEELAAMTREQTITFNNTIRARHWTTIVCDKHGIKHYNDGLSGSSQESVLHRAILAFDKFEQDGNVPTLAIIQLTNPGRITIYDEITFISQLYPHDVNFSRLHTGFDRTILFNFDVVIPDKLRGDSFKNYALAHMDVESKTGNSIRWLTALSATNSYFKEKTGRYPIYIKSLKFSLKDYTTEADANENLSSSPEYKSLVNQSRLHMLDTSIWELSHGDADNLLCPNYHHTPQTHANFAQFIAPHVLQELNNVS